MRFIPLTKSDEEQMLKTIGAKTVDDLFCGIPDKARLKKDLDLPEPLGERKLIARLKELAGKNRTVDGNNLFLGAGAYNHYVPSAVDQLLLRSEFFTAYTPYQPEISQGTLMAVYEFQSFTCALTGMEIANASMYDGASALAEAIIMAGRISRKKRIVISNLVHPAWRKVADTYTKRLDIDIKTIDNSDEAVVTEESLISAIDDQTGAVVLSYPSFFGTVQDLRKIKEITDRFGALLIVAVPEPLSLGILKSPGEMGADIVACEGASFGNSLSFGGPGLGMLATKQKWTRQLPGRLVGKTKDKNGEDGFVLTLATREQHIRREKATSNICSNQALCATAATMHLALLGKKGIFDLARRNMAGAEYLKNSLTALDGFSAPFENLSFFNEVVIKVPVEPEIVAKKLASENIVGGYDLSKDYGSMDRNILFCATENNDKESIDRLVSVLSEFAK